MNLRWPAITVLAALAALSAARADETSAACVSTSRYSDFRESFVTALDKAEEQADPQKEIDAFIAIRGRATTPSERVLLGEMLGRRLAAVGRDEEARVVLEPLLEEPHVARWQRDQIHTELAFLAGRKGDWPRVIGLLEPVVAAACTPVLDATSRLLAMAYLKSKRAADALVALDRARDPPPEEEFDWWTAVQVELRCKLEGPAACVNAAAAPAARGGLSPPLTDVLNTLLASAVTDPAAAGAWDRARSEQLIDEQGRVIARPLQPSNELVPLKRVAPMYPWKAARDGKTGFVQVEVVVAPDGSVKKVKVLEAKPAGYFEAATVRAALQARFKPKVVNGVAVESSGVYTVQFRL